MDQSSLIMPKITIFSSQYQEEKINLYQINMNIMKFKLGILAIVLGSFGVLNAQSKTMPFTLKIKANGFSNSYCFLANHFGKQKYKVDSIRLDKSGQALYVDKDKKVKGGIYILVFPTAGNQYAELIISGAEKNMEIQLDSSDFRSVKVLNSKENEIFYSDVKYLEPFSSEMSRLSTEYKSCPNDECKKPLEIKIRAKEKELVDRRISVIINSPTLLYSKILKLMRDVEVPEPPKDANGKIDSTFKYWYFKNHYWDHTDFNDDRLLFTPIFEDKFKYYFDQLIIKHPDTIKKECDFILRKINNPNSDMMRYCLASLLNDYANSKIMGQDALYVYLVDNYYAKGKAPWTDSADIKKMKGDADDLRDLLIGNYGKNFTVFDTTLVNYKSLYDMNTEYKVVVFWSQDCGHCKKEIPVLDSIYPSLLKEGCDVFAVCTVTESGDNVNIWKKFIRDNKLRFKNYADPKFAMTPSFRILYSIKGTPEYYILDRQNKIIAKKLAPEQMVDFLKNYKKTLKK